MDIFATAHALAGIELPQDRVLDTHDLTPLLRSSGAGTRDTFFYYRAYELMAVRWGPWKAHFMTQAAYGQPKPETHDPPVLYHLEHDPSEKYDVAGQHPEVIEKIRELVAEHRKTLQPAPSQLEL
jgi:arylsulfatase A-like enzyme